MCFISGAAFEDGSENDICAEEKVLAGFYSHLNHVLVLSGRLFICSSIHSESTLGGGDGGST